MELKVMLVVHDRLVPLLHAHMFAFTSLYKRGMQDPCSTFVLPDVICSACNDFADLDLCRNPAIQAREWRCGQSSEQ